MSELTSQQPVTTPAPPPWLPSQEPPRKSRRNFWIGCGIVGVLVVAFGIAGAADNTEQSGKAPFVVDEGTVLEIAAEQADSPYITVADDGRTLIIEGEGEESIGAPYTDIAATLAALEVPDSVVAQMDNTRALDGTLNADWEGSDGLLEAVWTYHPDNGFDVVITLAD